MIDDKLKNDNPERQRMIMDAALRVFGRRAFGSATMADVAAEAGVAVGSLYTYFPSKEKLLEALIKEGLVGALTRDLIQPADVSDLDFITNIIVELLAMGQANMERHLLIYSEIQRQPDFCAEYHRNVIQPTLEQIEKYFKSKIEAGQPSTINTNTATRLIMAMGIGSIILYHTENRQPSAGEMQATARSMAELILNGLKKTEEESDG